MVKTIFAQETAQDAHAQWNSVADALRDRSKARHADGRRRENVFAYTGFPKEHWPRTATTNPLERLNGQVKHRSDVVGIFLNDRAVIRLIGHPCSTERRVGGMAVDT
jgi:putative transposase